MPPQRTWRRHHSATKGCQAELTSVKITLKKRSAVYAFQCLPEVDKVKCRNLSYHVDHYKRCRLHDDPIGASIVTGRAVGHDIRQHPCVCGSSCVTTLATKAGPVAAVCVCSDACRAPGKYERHVWVVVYHRKPLFNKDSYEITHIDKLHN